MPEPTGKSADPQALELRLWVPAKGDLRNIAGELAAKVAEHLGASAPEAQAVAAKVAGVTAQLGNGGAPQAEDIAMEFRHADGQLVVEARCAGAASEVRHEIPV